MASRDGAREGGNRDIPNCGAAEFPSAGTPIAREGTPTSSTSATGERPEAPCPAQGIMFGRCCVCGTQLESTPVALGDDANGGVSHGYCPPCQAEALKEVGDVRYTDHDDQLPSTLWDIARTASEQFSLIPWATVALFIPWVLLQIGGGR